MSRLLLILAILWPCLTQAQPTKPTTKPVAKYGLSLSGGGAKGLAHIGLLRIIDSLGVRIDAITGTSMGAVMGSLYAAGYSGDSLKQIALNVPWDLLLSNKVRLDQINIEEKDEFGRYMLELPVRKLRPQLPAGLIEGQLLATLLTNLFFPVHEINDFSKLPIPFRCVATDAASGEAVVLKSGYLPDAVRASMAIPTVFTPVKLQGRLLIDGGIARNFPVEDLKEMGVTEIIGGYTGFRLLREEELNNAFKLFYQTQSYISAADAQKQIDLCEIFVDNSPYLGDLGAADFGSAAEIIAAGEAAARTLIPELLLVAEKQKREGGASYRRPTLQPFSQRVYLNCIRVEGASNENLMLIAGKLGLREGYNYNLSDLNEAVERIFGTRFFEKVNYSLEGDSSSTTFVLRVLEGRKGSLKSALHYDSEQSSGLLINLTYRNLIPSSRLVTTLDFSQRPKFNLHWYQFGGPSQKEWLSIRYLYEQQAQNIYYEGRLNQNLSSEFHKVAMGVNTSLNTASAIGFETDYQFSVFRPDIDPRDLNEAPENSLINIRMRNLGFNFRWWRNTLNQVLFPTRGHQSFIEFRIAGEQSFSINFFTKDSLFANNALNFRFSESSQLRLIADHAARWSRPNSKITWIARAGIGLTFNAISDTLNNLETSRINLLENFYLGGSDWRMRSNTIPFTGLRRNEAFIRQYILAGMGVQWQFSKSAFLIPSINIGVLGYDFGEFVKSITKFEVNRNNVQDENALIVSTGSEFLFGYGLTLGFKTILGPILLNLSTVNDFSVLRSHLQIGFRL